MFFEAVNELPQIVILSVFLSYVVDLFPEV